IYTTTSSTSTLSLHDALPISKLLKHFCLNDILERDHVRSSRTAFVDDRKRVICRDTRVAKSVTFVKTGILDQPRRGHLVAVAKRSEEHTSELQSQSNLVCRLL